MAGDNSHPEAIARLAGKRLVTSSEVDEGNRFSESLIKQLTGGDPVVARNMYGSSFEFTPQFKLFFAGNNKPVIHGMDHGIWRRVRLIPFTTQIPEDAIDQHFEEKLRPELSGILNWAIRGCLLWQESGLQEPEGIKVATKGYQSESNTVGKWIDERCSVDPTASTLLKILYSDYKGWSEENGETLPSRVVFSRKLEANGFDKVEPKTNKGYKIGGITLAG
jgi:putative DNA primase/helicase